MTLYMYYDKGYGIKIKCHDYELQRKIDLIKENIPDWDIIKAVKGANNIVYYEKKNT